jgi:hypothetical protein
MSITVLKKTKTATKLVQRVAEFRRPGRGKSRLGQRGSLDGHETNCAHADFRSRIGRADFARLF